MKHVALYIKQSSTKTYRLLKSIFKLPNLTTIARLIPDVEISAGFHNSILSGLKVRAESSKERDRYIVLGFDEIQLVPKMEYNRKDDRVEGIDNKCGKPIPVVNYAGVFMIRGLTTNMTQPIGHRILSVQRPNEIM